MLGNTSSVTAQIVYQDNFDNDGLGINTGIGGGGANSAFNFTSGPEWIEDGDLSAGDAGTGAHIWFFTSENTFSVAGGFTLEVEFDQQFIDDNTMAPFASNPATFTQFRGLPIGSPGTGDFAGPDGVVASYNPGFTISNIEAPVWLIFDYAAAASGGVDVTSFAGTPGLTMTVEYSIDGGANYVEIGTAGESFNTASTETFSLGGVSTDKIRVGWRRTGFTINFPWEVSIDAVNLCQ